MSDMLKKRHEEERQAAQRNLEWQSGFHGGAAPIGGNFAAHQSGANAGGHDTALHGKGWRSRERDIGGGGGNAGSLAMWELFGKALVFVVVGVVLWILS